MPLKNWGGFSIQRSWVYDTLEKVVLAGLAEQVIFNTKPLSRVEAARIVAQAVERLQQDQYGDYNHRGYLEDLLYQLVEEFDKELAEMGVRTPLNRATAPSFFEIHTVEHLQLGTNFATRKQSVINDLGRRVSKGGNLNPIADGRGHVGDFFSLYYQPEFSWDKESYQGRLLSGYGKFTLWNTEVEVGRDSLWWGPGYRGSMSFSNNTLPLNQVRVSSAEPFRLPWLLSYLGPIKPSLVLAQLEDNRDHPNAKVAAWRLALAPSRFVEVGFNRIFQFGGKGRGTVNPGHFFQLLFTQGSDNADSPLNVNNVMSFDATVRIPDIGRYIFIARDAAFYVDFGWDDTLFGLIVPDKPGGIVGTYLAGILGDPKLDLRIEYAKTSDIQFTHAGYTSGFTYRGSPLSHFIGTKGDDLYARLTRWISPNLLLGLQISKSHIGPTAQPLGNAPLTQSQAFGWDLSYRLSPSSSISLGYDFARLKKENRNNESDKGPGKNDNLFRIQFTHSFRK